MYKNIIFAAVGVMFSLACIGEKQTENKVVYATVAAIMFMLLLAGDTLIGA